MDYEGKFLKKRALIDEMLVNNKKIDKSHAEQKRRWIGNEGAFKSENLQEWFQTHDQTKIQQLNMI